LHAIGEAARDTLHARAELERRAEIVEHEHDEPPVSSKSGLVGREEDVDRHRSAILEHLEGGDVDPISKSPALVNDHRGHNNEVRVAAELRSGLLLRHDVAWAEFA
jgi:hypothetical protein